MSPRDRTQILVLATIAIWIIYDLATVGTYGVDPTISRVVLRWHQDHPWVAFGLGVLTGHWLLYQRVPTK